MLVNFLYTIVFPYYSHHAICLAKSPVQMDLTGPPGDLRKERRQRSTAELLAEGARAASDWIDHGML